MAFDSSILVRISQRIPNVFPKMAEMAQGPQPS